MARVTSRIERRLRKEVQRVFQEFYRHKRKKPPAIGQVTRVLLVRTDKIGDAIVSTPVVAALKMHFPGVKVDMLLGRRNYAAAHLLPQVDRTFVARRGIRPTVAMLRFLRKRRYDVAIDMVPGDSITAAIHTAGSGARIRIGFEDSASPFYELPVGHPDPYMHHAPRMLMLLAPLGIKVAESQICPSVVVSREALEVARQALNGLIGDGRKIVMVNISGSSPAKFWGAENFMHFTRELDGDSVQIVLLSAPGDADLLKEIAARTGAASISPLSDLMSFSAILSSADLVVTPDSSIVHIAAALGKPVVALVGSALVARAWGPWQVPNRTIACTERIADIPCVVVLEAARSLLEEICSGK